MTGEHPYLAGVLGQVLQHLEERVGTDPLALWVRRDGEPAQGRLVVLDADPDRADQPRPDPRADGDDVVARHVLAQLGKGLGEGRDIGVAADPVSYTHLRAHETVL